jgi:DNA-binding transcriptional MocR family regulator
VSFGAGAAAADLFPTRRLNAILRAVVRDDPLHSARYAFPPGLEALRQQIARRMPDAGYDGAPEDVVITSGALEAIGLSLRAVAAPGDVIALESPVYFGILQSAASLGLRVVEISTDPQHGINLDELDRAARKHRIKACVTLPSCHNPLGYIVPDANRAALVALALRRGFTIVEDDIYGDLAFAESRPRAIKAFDRDGAVVLCSSISKVLAPGFRVGWVIAGERLRATIERLKLVTTVATAALPQRVVAAFFESGGYDRHVRSVRRLLGGQVGAVRAAIARYFPIGTRVSRPQGGYMVWVELPPGVDALKLHRAALAARISIVPGPLFSASGQYRNCVRINCGMTWTPSHDRALSTLGRLCTTV